MDFISAIILGIVEGLTEFLPISSTGHLILAGHVLGKTGPVVETFDVFIQLGAILAVVFLYSQRFVRLFDFNEGKGFSGWRGWQLLILTSLPATIVGFLAHDFIKDKLFNPVTVAIALLVGGIGILLVERLKLRITTESLDTLTNRQALLIGCFQCIALWPGFSRSASTIIGGMFTGLNRKLAAEYSFLAAVPIMAEAVTYDLLKALDTLQMKDLPIFAVGFVVSFISALLAIKFFIHLLQRWSLTPFAFYRIALALLTVWFLRNSLFQTIS